MDNTVFSYIFKKCPEISRREVMRYAGIKGNIPENAEKDILSCILEVEKTASPKACYMRVPVRITGKIVDFGFFRTESEKLAVNLKNTAEAFLFAVTVGTGVDRLINRYSALSPVKALYFQAAGAAAVESVCDYLCDKVFPDIIGEEKGLKPRFSPGYGDLSISVQKEFINLLDCHRKIGLYLTDGNMMVPTKSVTAIAGITNAKESCKYGCENCENWDCEFRGKG